MTHPRWCHDDDELLTELGGALRSGHHAPANLLGEAKAIYTWRTVDAELATLVYDSIRNTEPMVVRAESAPVRSLTFECDALVIELGVCTTTLIGELVPAQPGTITIRGLAGPSATATVDDLGCFRVEPVPSGAFSLHVQTGQADVVTDWVTK